MNYTFVYTSINTFTLHWFYLEYPKNLMKNICAIQHHNRENVMWSFISESSVFKKIKLMKGKAPRKHSLHEKTAASVLLKLFIMTHG